MGKTICHDCGVEEGKFHQPGCDMERCPFCGHQLISCNCCYELLGLYDPQRYDDTTGFIPPEIYENGLSEEQEKIWDAILEAKGKVPYIVFPNICGRCGKLWPDFFRVSDEEWKKYIPIDSRELIICRTCYDEIKGLIDGGGK